ncbi:hypothetical protein C448_00250 [Halococcus morrhuae DSM 1307]|uniref:Uncharacterized protein n=1 Tax=Halococcus morrhuae DSM 1307 TaxID=931277 RepID=M0N4I3_HALMO|nr:hypothetical protein C448_00250 [Halococcus morrhuae DSM 1307]
MLAEVIDDHRHVEADEQCGHDEQHALKRAVVRSDEGVLLGEDHEPAAERERSGEEETGEREVL